MKKDLISKMKCILMIYKLMKINNQEFLFNMSKLNKSQNNSNRAIYKAQEYHLKIRNKIIKIRIN